MSIVPCATEWNVITFADGRPDGHAMNLANDEPRMLRWIIEPHTDTHRVVAADRRRAASGPSFVRLLLDPISEPGASVVVHAVLLRGFMPQAIEAPHG